MTPTPTELWRSPTLTIPNLGMVRHPRGGALVASPDQLEWLIANQYVVGGDSSSSLEPTAPLLEPWQIAALDFINNAESIEEIDTRINGVGAKKATELFNAQPLNWDAIAKILTQAQVKALQKTFTPA